MKIAISLLFLCSFAAAARETGWPVVAALPAGEAVRVHTAAARYEGTVASVGGDTIVLNTSTGTESIARNEVRRVYARGKSHRLRNAIIGTLVGVGVGAAIYGTLGVWFRNEGAEDTAYMLVAPIGVGAAIGSVLPTGGMKKIYDAKR